MGVILGGIYEFKDGVTNKAQELKNRLGELGWLRGLNKIYVMGLEKTTKLVIATGKLALHNQAIKNLYGEAIKTIIAVSEKQTELYYAFWFIPSTADLIGATRKFIKARQERGKITGTLQERTRIVRESQIGELAIKWISTIGSYFDTGQFLQKYDICEFPRFRSLATRLEEFKLGKQLNIQPFTYRPLYSLCSRPKDFCTLIVATLEISQFIFLYYFTDAPDDVKEELKKELLSLDNCLKLLPSIGKISLYWLASQYSKTLGFDMINFIIQTDGFTAGLIKKAK